MKKYLMRLAAASCMLPFALANSIALAADIVPGNDSEALSLTIYNQNFGLVRDVRSMDLTGGINNVRFEDVAARIDPTSVSIQSLTAPNSVVVREQNYQYDLLEPTSILSKSVGKTLKLRRYLEGGQVRELTGTLLNPPVANVSDTNGNTSTRYQGLVLKTPGGIILNPGGEIEISELPPGLVSKPSLLWKLETTKPGTHKAEIAYQTSGLNWNCDYVSVLDDADAKADLTSWVTLDNKSGASYKNAALKLMAGDVHRVTPPPMAYAEEGMAMDAAMPASAPAPQFKEQSFAEYHLYTLQNKTSILDNETKQLSLFNASNVPVKKVFVYDPTNNNVQPMYERGGGGNNGQKVNVKIEFENSDKNHLGMPMPKGKVRVYKKDSDGALQFIGEDLIDHTPKDEKVRLYIGDAFDLVGEYQQTNMEQVSDRVQRMSYQIKLRNHKNTDVRITVVQHAYGDWTIMNSTMPHTKKDSTTFEFDVPVAANKESTVSYTIEQRY